MNRSDNEDVNQERRPFGRRSYMPGHQRPRVVSSRSPQMDAFRKAEVRALGLWFPTGIAHSTSPPFFRRPSYGIADGHDHPQLSTKQKAPARPAPKELRRAS